jgi:hypothetical protein
MLVPMPQTHLASFSPALQLLLFSARDPWHTSGSARRGTTTNLSLTMSRPSSSRSSLHLEPPRKSIELEDPGAHDREMIMTRQYNADR